MVLLVERLVAQVVQSGRLVLLMGERCLEHLEQ